MDVVRRVCQKDFKARAIRYLDGTWPTENMKSLAEIGVQTRVISTYAPEPIKRRILPRVAAGEVILAICMTEPNAGTDVPNYATNTDIKGNRVVVNGVKTLISRADIAEMFVVFTLSIRVTSEAIRVHGGYGFTDEFPVSRYFRGTRYGSLGGGTTETLRNLVGKKLVEQMDLATGMLGMGTF